MSIQKAYRTISEKLTSVEDPIEVTQKGKVSFKSISAYLPVPTTIQNVWSVKLLPMNASAALVLHGGSAAGISPKKSGWHCDLVKYKANDVSTVLKFTQAANFASAPVETIALNGAVLYQFLREVGTAATATGAVGAASASIVKKVAGFSSNANALNFLKVTLRGVSFAATNCKVAYEVKGYNDK